MVWVLRGAANRIKGCGVTHVGQEVVAGVKYGSRGAEMYLVCSTHAFASRCGYLVPCYTDTESGPLRVQLYKVISYTRACSGGNNIELLRGHS